MALPSADQPPDAASVIFRTRLHPMSCAGAVSLAAFVVFAGTLVIRHNDLPAATDARIALGTFALALVSLAGAVVRWVRSEFSVTRTHLFARVTTRGPAVAVAWRDVAGVEAEYGVLGRWLDYGTVVIVGQSEDDATRFHHVAAPGALREAWGSLAPRRRPA